MPEALTWPQIVTAVIAILAATISLVSLRRTSALQRHQLRLAKKQEELTDLQLEALRRQAAASNVPPQEKADVRVELIPHGREHRFVITNWGRVPARNVTFELEIPQGSHTPLVQGDYDQKLPIAELAPGGRCPLWAAFTFGMPPAFKATWSWTNPDGSRETRSSLLAI